MGNKIAIFPEWGGYKIKFNGSTIGAVPGGKLDLAKERAAKIAVKEGEAEYDILDKDKNVTESIKV